MSLSNGCSDSDMELVTKAAAVGIAASVLALTVRKNNPETALLISVAAAVSVVAAAVSVVTELKDFVQRLSEAAMVSPAVISPMFKTAAVGIVAKLAADICRDAGLSSMASAVELSGCVAALYLALPLMRAVFSMIEGFV